MHLAEHLPDGVLLVEEELLDQRRGDRHFAGRDASDLAATEKVDFATLSYGLFRRGDVCIGHSMFINGPDVDGASKEGTASDSLESIMTRMR